MVEFLGASFTAPTFELGGLISSSWIWVGFVFLMGVILFVGVGTMLFLFTFNRKIELYEDVSGQGLQRTMTTRARRIKLGITGEEIFRTLKGGLYLTAYGRKIARNTYAFAKGRDGYWYNFIHGDLDAKMAILDIDLIDRDVRMFHVALSKLAQSNYGKQGFMEKWGGHMILLFVAAILLAGQFFIVAKQSEGIDALADTSRTNEKVGQLNLNTLKAIDNIKRGDSSGIIALNAGADG